MRALPPLVVLALALAGCASPDAPSAVATPTPDAGTPDIPPQAPPPGALVAEVPTHPPGRAWTYASEERYNDDDAFTVVVARADASGYLFAGGTEDDLVYHALWSSPWLGACGLDLDCEVSGNRLEFPLRDGDTWTLWEGLTVAATETDVTTPSGTERGFRIEGANDHILVRYDYAPSLGQIVLYEATRPDGTLVDRVRMTRAAEDQPWTWYELGDLVVVPAPHEPRTFEITEGWDAVIASAGGLKGSRASIVPPEGSAWSVEFGDETETWRHGVLPATPGRYEAALVGWPYMEGAPEVPAERPVGWAYMHVAPVRWVPSSA